MELLAQGIAQRAHTGWPKTLTLAMPALLRLDTEVRVLKLTLPPFCAWVPEAKEISIPSPALVVRGGSLAPPRIDAVAQGTAKDRRRDLAALSDGEIVYLVLAWLYAVWLPWFGSRLPQELHGVLSDSLATFAIALAITWRIRDKHK